MTALQFSVHARQRMCQRGISEFDVVNALAHVKGRCKERTIGLSGHKEIVVIHVGGKIITVW